MKVTSLDKEHLSMPEQHLENSEAYLYSAKILCQNLIEQPEELSYAKGCVCMFNARLSIELFLKSALLKKEPNLKLNHSIEELRDQYHALYPEMKYQWEVPYTLQIYGYEGSQTEDIVKKHNKDFPQDQILRYPMNRKKEPWGVFSVFTPNDFLNDLKLIELDIVRIKVEIFS